MFDTPRDDRGKRCSMAGLSRRQLAWRTLGLSSITPDKVTSREMQKTDVAEIVISLVGGVIGWAIWTRYIGPQTGPVLGELLDVFAQSTFTVIVALVIWYLGLSPLRRAMFGDLAEVYLGEGLCPACGYALLGLDPEDDACVVCPECNAAWNHDRIGSPT